MPVTVEALVIVVLLVAPGLIAARTLRAENPSPFRADRPAIFLALLFSLLVHALLLPFTLALIPDFVAFRASIEQAMVSGTPARLDAGIVFWAAAVLLVVPAAMGWLLSRLWRANWARPLWHRLGLSIVQLTPTAWDWFFLSQRDGCWVVAELADGTVVGGEFGTNSFASLSPNDKDLYLEKEYYVDEDHNFLDPIPDSVGIWVSGDKVKHLHMYRVAEGG